MRQILDMPWATVNEVRRISALPFIRLMFRFHGVTWGNGWRIFGMPIIQRHRRSSIAIGPNVVMRSWRTSNPLAPNHPVVLATRCEEACIKIGADCGLTGATVVAAESVTLGDRVQIGANCVIVDTDFHPLQPDRRMRNFTDGVHRPVSIGEDVFVGMNSLILKGVTIGSGSVVGAGSVVAADVPAGVIVAGNPARLIRNL